MRQADDRNTSSPAPTAADARKFLDERQREDVDARHPGGQAGWVQQTYITDDTEAIAARANQAGERGRRADSRRRRRATTTSRCPPTSAGS